ncbi:hypothetical protein O4J56_10450 [Nocardiopsis sp. RSe5-2]|uniref:Uncharacterized protein n=1 Tax=Nocardiopsis endophytica TaxID=3018445 RepID=A0ABT4U2Y7_9ACTN|nr:hypothetical protein [Nocardiopsis endophytica]MDA2811056.1 hypothetical protein [Nocardiopsis endophytica]
MTDESWPHGRDPRQVLDDLGTWALTNDELLVVITYAKIRLAHGAEVERRAAWAEVALAASDRFLFHADPRNDRLKRATEKCGIHLSVRRKCPEDCGGDLGLPSTMADIALRELPDDLSEVERDCARWRQDPRATIAERGIERIALLRNYKNLLSRVLEVPLQEYPDWARDRIARWATLHRRLP